MTRDEALEKVRKLLANNGRTHAEAETAQILAAAIAERHGIDIANVDRADEARRVEITHKEMDTWTQTPIEAECASLICKAHFEISPITQRTRVSYIFNATVETLNFVGTECHLRIAEHVFQFLVREFRWQWRHRRGRCKKRKPFMWGCYCALASKLDQRFARPASEGANEIEISWRARREKYIEEHFGKTRSVPIAPKEKGGAAIHRGWQAGHEIEIRPGVDRGNARQPAGAIGEGQRLLGF